MSGKRYAEEFKTEAARIRSSSVVNRSARWRHGWEYPIEPASLGQQWLLKSDE